MDAVSADGAIEIYAQTDNAETIEDRVKQSIDDLTGEGVKLKSDPENEVECEHNDLKMATIGWKGTDKDGDSSVSLIILQVSEDTTMTLIYWATEGMVKKYEKDINKVLDSMKSSAAKEEKKDEEKGEKPAEKGK